MSKKALSALLGIAVLAFGVLYAGNVIGFWDVNFSFDGWWTLFLIIPCAISVINGGVHVVNSMGLIIGVLMLLSEQNVLKENLGYKLIVPAILIAIGFSIIFRKTTGNAEGTNGVFAGSSGENFFAVFGGNAPNFTGEIFRGANAYAIFGGVDLRLRDAVIKRDCKINVYSIFGGSDIFLPENVKCVVSSLPIFGGVDNAFVSSASEGAPTVYIYAVSVFGATDIK